MIWNLTHPNMTPEHLGFIPSFVNEADPRSAIEQFNENYQFGGWKPVGGFELRRDGAPKNWTLTYPGDPALPVLAYAHLRDEIILFFPHSWVAVVSGDGFEVSRMD